MKGTFFSKPLEWNIETQGESWQQGSTISGLLKLKNHGAESVSFDKVGVGLAFADIKKIHAKTEGALKLEVGSELPLKTLSPGGTFDFPFSLALPENCPVSDKKSSFFLTYGRDLTEGHLQLKIEPKVLYQRIIGLMDTFFRFKLKEMKGSKAGVEYKLIPPTARDMANLEGLNLSFSMKDEVLHLSFEFQVKKLDTGSVTTKINKDTVKIKKEITKKEYSLGKDMINQDQLLKILESVLAEVKMKSVF